MYERFVRLKLKTYHEVCERGETRIHNFNDFPEEEKAA
jgi:hypothetical protein